VILLTAIFFSRRPAQVGEAAPATRQ